jgi:Methyltransferase domain
MARARARIGSHGVGKTVRHVFTDVLPKVFMDLRYGGRYCFDLPDLNKDTGRHGLIHSSLTDLVHVFSHIDIRPGDVLVDIGCGAGRVLNYWLSLDLPNKLIGIEYNGHFAQRAAQTYHGRKNVKILSGDAAEIAPGCGGTLFYLFDPLPQGGMNWLESGLRGKPVRILYYNPHYLAAFENDAWRITHIPPQDGADYPLAIIVSTALD